MKQERVLYQVDTGRREIINQEQQQIDTVAILDYPDAPKTTLNPSVLEQADQAEKYSKEKLHLRGFKKRQIQDYTTDFAISQITPSPWVTIINVVNSIILTVALIVAFFIAFGLLFGLKVGVVTTDSMTASNSGDKDIPVGSFVVMKPLSSIREIRVGDVLSYVMSEEGDDEFGAQASGFANGYYQYLHEVEAVSGNVIVMKGTNDKYADARHWIGFDSVKGRMIVNVPYLGYVVAFVRNNIFLVISALITLITALLLIKVIVEARQSRRMLVEFVGQKILHEQLFARKLDLIQQENDKHEIADLLSMNNKTPEKT